MPSVLVVGKNKNFLKEVRVNLNHREFVLRVLNKDLPSEGVPAPSAERYKHDVVVMEVTPANFSQTMKSLKNISVNQNAPAVLLALMNCPPNFKQKALAQGMLHAIEFPRDMAEITHWVKLCLRNHRLQQEYRLLTRELELFKTIKALAKILDLERLLTTLMDAAMELMRSQFGVVILARPGNIFEIAELRGLSQDYTSDGIFGLTYGSLKRILESSEPKILTPRHNSAFSPKKIDENVRISSAIVAQIKTSNEQLGLMILAREKAPDLTSEDAYILKRLLQETSDIIENALSHKYTKELTMKDDLTSAYNRRYFEAYVEDEIRRAKRFKTRLSLIFLDLDNLRQVNDNYGHFMGSRALMESAHRMLDSVRSIDKVVRFGGDEFCIVLPETDAKGALYVAQRVRDKILEKPFLLAEIEKGVKLTASFGIAEYPEHAQTKEDLIKRADEAMFGIKTKEKGGIAIAKSRKVGAKKSK